MKAVFQHQLSTSADGLIWAVEQIPDGRYNVIPLPVFGDEPVIQLVFAQVWYEERIVLPYMRAWMDDQLPDVPTEPPSTGEHHMANLLQAFKAGRDEQIQLLATYNSWDTVKSTVWGDVPLSWLLTRTYQTTLETTNRLLQMALYWDLYLLELQNARLQEGRKKDNQW